MPEHGLQVTQLCPVLQHVCRAGVSEQVARAFCIDAGVLHVPLHAITELGITERLAVITQEQRLLFDVEQQLGPYRVEIPRHPVHRPLADGQQPVFVAHIRIHIRINAACKPDRITLEKAHRDRSACSVTSITLPP